MNKAIITGPTGAIGIALINELTYHGYEVAAICHRGSERIKRIPCTSMVKVIECNLDELARSSVFWGKDYDVFFHLGWAGTYGDARNDTEVQLSNIAYTLDAVELAQITGCKRFVGVGSQAEYGRTDRMLDPELATFPENGYGMAKLCAGQLSRLRCQQLGLEHVWARVLSVYGPYDGEKTLISVLIRSLMNGESPKCTKGEQIWDYLYSKDAAHALRLMGELGISNKVYCVGSGVGRPLREYVETVGSLLNPDIPIRFGDVPYSENQVMHLQADISDLKLDVGFEPKYTFEDGIKETIDWMGNS